MWSVSLIVSVIIVAYIFHTVWVMYFLFYPSSCKSGQCIEPYLKKNPTLKLHVYTSYQQNGINSQNTELLWQQNNFDVNKPIEKSFNVSIAEKIRKKGFLYLHILICPEHHDPFRSTFTTKASSVLTTQMMPQAETFKLIGGDSKKENPSTSQPIKQSNHWHSRIYFSVMVDLFSFDTKAMLADLYTFVNLTPYREYLPILYMDELSQRTKDYLQIKADTSQLPLTVVYSPITIGKLRFFHHMEQAFNSLKNFGFSEKDSDDVKGIFIDTNFYLLILTFVISFLHLLFDFLAFKNDISFWRKRESMVGLSSKAVIWRCVSQTVIFLFLLDEETSLIVTVPNGLGLLIELWKLTKAFKMTITWQTYPRIKFGSTTDVEKQTEAFDSEGMRYLSYALYPLCITGAIYSLIFVSHKSWYSWCVHSLVNGVYAFGFLFMLPQLFVNYKLKSVAHLPWKAFMYKAFNTFIDDIFAFIITMPVAHRVACFRDDLVFVFYLYQRWLYPVDKSRFNEYGTSYEETKDKKKN